MVSTLGVIDGRLLLTAKPKKWFLAFDRLAIIGFEAALRNARDFFKDQHLLNDIEWLANQDFVYEPQTDTDESVRRAEAAGLMDDPKWIEFVRYVQEVNTSLDMDAFGKTLRSESAQERDDALGQWLMWLQHSGSLASRFWAPLLAQPDIEAIPIVGDRSLYTESTLTLGGCMQVVVSKLPQPDDSTPWDELLQFKKDPDTRLKYLGLRRWLRSVVSTNTSIEELEEEIEYHCAQFEDHMNRARLKYTKGPSEWWARVPLEISEELLKGKFSDLSKRLFSAKYREIELQEAERTAPGRELSFVAKAERTFRQE